MAIGGELLLVYLLSFFWVQIVHYFIRMRYAPYYNYPLYHGYGPYGQYSAPPVESYGTMPPASSQSSSRGCCRCWHREPHQYQSVPAQEPNAAQNNNSNTISSNVNNNKNDNSGSISSSNQII